MKPDKLYRYRSNSSYSIKSLINYSTIASSPIILNDYLDSSLRYNIEKIYQKLKNSKKLRRIIEFQLYKEYKISIHEADFYNSNYKYEIFECIKKRCKYIIENIKKSFLIISLTTKKDNPVMWSHYASNSKGFVVEYDFSLIDGYCKKLKKDTHLNNYYKEIIGIYKVKYNEEFYDCSDFLFRKMIIAHNCDLLPRELFDIKSEQDFEVIKKILTFKQKYWEYEDEYRVIIPNHFDNDTYESDDIIFKWDEFVDVGNFPINNIYIGENMEIENKVIISSFAFVNGITLYVQNRNSLVLGEKMLFDNINPEDFLKSVLYKKILFAKKISFL